MVLVAGIDLAFSVFLSYIWAAKSYSHGCDILLINAKHHPTNQPTSPYWNKKKRSKCYEPRH